MGDLCRNCNVAKRVISAGSDRKDIIGVGREVTNIRMHLS